MATHVNSAAPRFFRCVRLCATITAEQCRANRARWLEHETLLEFMPARLLEPAPPCQDCPQAPRVDAGLERFFTLRQVLAGQARAQSAVDAALPWEQRITAQPSDKTAFSSAFWVPEWDR